MVGEGEFLQASVHLAWDNTDLYWLSWQYISITNNSDIVSYNNDTMSDDFDNMDIYEIVKPLVPLGGHLRHLRYYVAPEGP